MFKAPCHEYCKHRHSLEHFGPQKAEAPQQVKPPYPLRSELWFLHTAPPVPVCVFYVRVLKDALCEVQQVPTCKRERGDTQRQRERETERGREGERERGRERERERETRLARAFLLEMPSKIRSCELKSNRKISGTPKCARLCLICLRRGDENPHFTGVPPRDRRPLRQPTSQHPPS